MGSYYNDINHIKNEAKKYVSQYKDDTNVFDKLDEIKDTSQLNKLLLIVRKWYYNKFVQGRRNQLANIYDKVQSFANRDCSEEIQTEIDNYFDLTNIIYKSSEGYSLSFDNEGLSDVVSYISSLDSAKVSKRCVEMERVLESNTNNNINLYTSLLFLRDNRFDSRNGIKRFESVYYNCDDTSKEEIYESIAKTYYKVLNNKQKEELLREMFRIDRNMLKRVFLENVTEDEINRKYWIPFINDKLRYIIKGGK